MGRHVQMKLNCTWISAERRERLQNDWAIFAGRCSREIKARKEERKKILSTDFPIVFCSRTPKYKTKKERNRVLENFWKNFNQLHNKNQRIRLLQSVAALGFTIPSASELKRLRDRFNRNKNSYYRLRGKCRACGGAADIRHHIIQLQNGGSNDGSNILRLCNNCHQEVHPWMKSESAS